jgi:hypothetical protein
MPHLTLHWLALIKRQSITAGGGKKYLDVQEDEAFGA